MSFSAHPSAVIDPGCQIGDGTRIWHFCHLMEGCTLGTNCNIGQNVFVAKGVVVGNNVKIQNNVSLYEGVICEDEVFIGPSAVFTNILNPRSAINRKGKYLSTIISKGATIGANATIVCGTNIGAYALVGAGAVVTKDVPAYALVVGNPASQAGWVSRAGIKLLFDENNHAVCTETGEAYTLKNGLVNVVEQ